MKAHFFAICQWFTLALKRKKHSLLFLNANILWPWERVVVKCFQATIKAQDNKTQKKIPKPWKHSRLKRSKPGFTEEKQHYLVWLQQCRRDVDQLCRSSAASPSAVLDTDSSCALSLASNRGSCCHGQSQGGTRVPFFLSFPLGVFS